MTPERLSATLVTLSCAIPVCSVLAAGTDIELPSGVSVHNNSIFGPSLADDRKMPLYVFVCEGERDHLSPDSAFGGGPKGICERALMRLKETPKLGQPACIDDACTKEHPPLLAAGDYQPFGDWTRVQRPDGSYQLAYKGKLLYRYSHDTMPDFPLGSERGGVWSLATVVTPTQSGVLAAKSKAAIVNAPGVTMQATNGGPVLADHRGQTLYSLNLPLHESKRQGAIEDSSQLRPLNAPAIAAPVGDWTPVMAADKTRYWSYRGRAVYLCDDDLKPGDRNCENTSWHVIMPEQVQNPP